jgi:hypothetical protein
VIKIDLPEKLIDLGAKSLMSKKVLGHREEIYF